MARALASWGGAEPSSELLADLFGLTVRIDSHPHWCTAAQQYGRLRGGSRLRLELLRQVPGGDRLHRGAAPQPARGACSNARV